MNEKNSPGKKDIAILKDEPTFLQELDWNLERVRKFNHRITLLLVQVKGPGDPEPTLPGFVRRLSGILRDTDTIYQIKEGLFAAILLGTHEAGGEAAALRIKRLMIKGEEGALEEPLKVFVGVASIGPEDPFLDPQVIYDVLKKDLNMDINWEYRNIESGEAGSDHTDNPGNVVVLATESLKKSGLIKDMEGAGYRCYQARGPEDGVDYIRELEQGVLVIDEGLPIEMLESVCQKIQFNRSLDSIFKICLKTPGQRGALCKDVFDQLLPVGVEGDILVEAIKVGLETSRLRDLDRKNSKFRAVMDSMKMATHKLNQPLQVILGKTELIILDIKDRRRDLRFLSDLEEIRKQARKTADINSKIQRLLNN